MSGKTLLRAAVAAGSLLVAGQAPAAVVITEWLYHAGHNAFGDGAGEFVEFTNIGASAVDFAGWAYDDDSRVSSPISGAFDLSAFGIVAPGESVIITELTEAQFRIEWGLVDSGVKILGGYTNNLGRNDEINLYDNGSLIDRLTYGDQDWGSIRTQGRSGHAGSAAALGANDSLLWVLSSVGDVEGSWASINGSIGSPGVTSFAPVQVVPVPAALPLLVSALGGLAFMRRRRG